MPLFYKGNYSMKHHVKGITLIELIVALMILAIMTTLAAPAFSKFMAKQKLSSDLFKLKTLIESSRSKAISTKETIAVCGTSGVNELEDYDLDSCTRDWQHVHILAVRGNDTRLHFEDKLTDSYSKIEWSAFQRKKYLAFSSTGYTQHQNGTLYLCHKHHEELHRAVVVSKSGRVTIQKEKASIGKKCVG